MLPTVRRYLTTLPFSDPLAQHQARLFQGMVLGWLVLASVGVPALLLLPGAEQPGAPAAPVPQGVLAILGLLSVAAVLLWLTPVIALVLLRRGHLGEAVGAALGGFLVSHSIATVLLGAGDASVLVMFQVPIVVAGILTQRRTRLIVSGYSLALVSLVAWLQQLSPPRAAFMTTVIAPAQAPMSGQPLALNVGFFVAVTIVLTLFLDRFGGALNDALITSRANEAALQQIRTDLETTVAERTVALQTALDEVQATANEQAQLLAQLHEQRAVIKALSVPVIPVAAGILVMPLVGTLDHARLEHLQTHALEALERTAAHTLLLDLTGVSLLDAAVAQGLLLTIQAGRLLGADIGLVGIRPEVAQTLVGLGLCLPEIRTFQSLQAALAPS